MRMRPRRFFCALLVLFQLLGGLPWLHKMASGQTRTSGRSPLPVSQAGDGMKGLMFRLSEGAPVSDEQPPRVTSPYERLSEGDTRNLLGRLQPIKADATDEQDFAIRDRSLPAPRTGKTIDAAFPPKDSATAPDSSPSGPLEVLRFSPEGDVPLAPQLSVTFSHPMVAVTSHSDTTAEGVPVRLTPQPEGRWRWIGTKTLLFETPTRMPMATEFLVEVPAGTKSATGATLAAARAWKFSTPPPHAKTFYPSGGPQGRNPLMFVEFDQLIDKSAVLETVRLRASDTQHRVRLATDEEIAADQAVSRLAAAAEKGRWLAFRVIDSANSGTPLPTAASVNVSIGPGTPSLEGPRKTVAAQSFSFYTYGPLRVTDHRCGWNDQCSPFDQWRIEFSNPLDTEAFEQSHVRVEPEIAGMKVAVYGNTIVITGIKRGRTTYRVTLDPRIRDQFGQALGETRPLTFNVKSAPPALASTGGQFIVLDPAAQPRYSVFSINHNTLRLRLYSVGPDDWRQFVEYMQERDDAPRQPPGRLVVSKTINVESQADEMVETRIDLAPALRANLGQVVVVVEPAIRTRNRWESRPVKAWVQVTGIGLDAFVDNTDLLGWATSLKDGRPLDGVQMSVGVAGPGDFKQDATSETRADGLARLSLASRTASEPSILVARKGNDLAILPESTYWWSTPGRWHKKFPLNSLGWYVFDDRKMYRPGEEVHLKGWIRQIGAGTLGDVEPLGNAATGVSYSLKDSRNNEILKGAAPLNALGGFNTVVKLPPTMNLGYAHLEFHAQGENAVVANRSFQHAIQVQEFRRPEFEVSAQATEGPHFVGGNTTATVTAAYYAGGGLPNAEVTWTVTSTPGYFTPPNRSDFTFGKWLPWWVRSHEAVESRTETFAARTDAAGKHNLKIDFISVDPPRPTNVTAEASVTDVNRQAWNARASVLVHPADLYVGIRSTRTFVQKGEPFIIQSIVTDLDGKAIPGREIRMRAVLMDWVFEKGQWQQKETSPQECVVKSAAGAVECRFETKEGGVYRVTAAIYDDRERRNESEMTVWVAGGKVVPRRNVEQEDVDLIPDRKDYQPGDTAEILVQSPFYPAEGVLSLRRSGILSTERFRMDGPSHTLKVPIREGYTPNLHVQIDLVGATARTDEEGKPNERLPRRPAFAKGSLNLPVPPLARKLKVEAAPRDKALEPGGVTTIDVEVRDARGEPVAGTELAVVVVDEAVLALTGYRIGDPAATFYAHRGPETTDYHLRRNILLSNPDDLIGQLQQGTGIGGGVGNRPGFLGGLGTSAPAAAARLAETAREFNKDGADQQSEQIRVRENFNALATFAPAVPTDANGRARVEVKLPDNLTRYRVMAVAVAGGKQFGITESAITARLPLMVRPSPPRFLNFGDRFELPVVVQNQTDSPMQVDVAVRAANAELTDGSGRRVTVPANDRIEVRFPASAMRAGTARFQIAAVSGKWTDAAEVSLPVWTPATTEAFATYGEIDQGAIIQPVKAPSDAISQFGGLEVTTSSTQLQALTDAVLYLTSYPFECSEQLSSRVLAIAALRDVLAAFEAKGLPEPKELIEAVSRDIKRLQARQDSNGGFGFWRRGDDVWPYVSVHVAHALQRAKEKNFEVPREMLDRAKNYLREIERHIPAYYSPASRRAIISYALYVRNRMGDRDTAKARRLIAEAGIEGLSLESLGWLLGVLTADAGSAAEAAAIRRHLNNRATEEAGTAHFVTSYTDGEHLLLHSNRRSDGVILESLIVDQPQNDLIPKVVRGLLAHRKAGRWGNTQENAFVLLALDKYFAVYEKATPDFVARAWLGKSYAGGHEFRGRTTDRHHINIPMRYVSSEGGEHNLVLSKEGSGRLYYRVGMQYAPASLRLEAADHGFTVQRAYEAVDKGDDVRRDEDGTWRIRAGAKVRVRLTMVAPSRRYHVALVDPMPAGLEALNPALAVTGSVPLDPKDQKPGGSWWWWRAWRWFEHQNMRDERVEAFTSLLWEGVYNYSYVARATTPGVFVVPPPKAEEMYHPETFGRGATDRVIIE